MSDSENQETGRENANGEQSSFLIGLARQGRGAASVAFFFVLQWGIDTVAKATGQERSWWAPILLNGTTAAGVITFFIVVGFEVLTIFSECRNNYLRRFSTSKEKRGIEQ